MPEPITRRTTTDNSEGDAGSVTLTGTGTTRLRVSPSVPAAKSGTLSARTDSDTGTATMASGHGFSTGNKVDVFWNGGKRRNMTATVTSNSVALDGGSGDALPAVNTAITAMVPTSVNFPLTGDDVQGIMAYSPAAGFVVLFDDAGTPAAIAGATYTLGAGQARGWVSEEGNNPLASKTTTVAKFSHGSTSAQVMKLDAVY